MEPQNQKQALRRLAAISKMIPLEHFYSININRWGNVSLQGNFDKEVVMLATRNKFAIKANDNLGYISFIRDHVDIYLL